MNIPTDATFFCLSCSRSFPTYDELAAHTHLPPAATDTPPGRIIMRVDRVPDEVKVSEPAPY